MQAVNFEIFYTILEREVPLAVFQVTWGHGGWSERLLRSDSPESVIRTSVSKDVIRKFVADWERGIPSGTDTACNFHWRAEAAKIAEEALQV